MTVLKSTALELSTSKWRSCARVDGDNGAVSWVDFVRLAPAMVAEMMSGSTAGVRDWCQLAYTDDGPAADVYWYNKVREILIPISAGR